MGGWTCLRIPFCWLWNASQNSKLQSRFLGNNSPSHYGRRTLLICSLLTTILPAEHGNVPLLCDMHHFSNQTFSSDSFPRVFKSRSDETNVTRRQTDVKKGRASTRAAFFSSLSICVSRTWTLFSLVGNQQLRRWEVLKRWKQDCALRLCCND